MLISGSTLAPSACNEPASLQQANGYTSYMICPFPSNCPQITFPDTYGLGPGVLIMGGASYNEKTITKFVEIYYPYKNGTKVYSFPIKKVRSPL
jgi:hypothetical protein